MKLHESRLTRNVQINRSWSDPEGYNPDKEGHTMLKKFTLEYWIDDGWYVGRLQEVPGVFSQGENFEELKENIRDAYQMIMRDVDIPPHPESKTMEIEVVV